jgi:LysM repeat protein
MATRPMIKNHPLLIILLAAILVGCNAPANAPRSTLAFTEEDLRQTAEAILTLTPPASSVQATNTLENLTIDSVWPTLIPTGADDVYIYQVQAGDTLTGLAGRFSVTPGEIQSTVELPRDGYLKPQLKLIIPMHLGQVSSAQRLLPDSELVYSASASDFDVIGYINEAAGYISEHREIVREEGWESSGAEIIQRVASELSVNPRLLLALLEYRSGWVYDHPLGAERNRYPIGFRISDRQGLYEEIKIAATQLNLAYYGWREGNFTAITYDYGKSIRLDPTLNAGSVALMNLFAILSNPPSWENHLYAPYGFPVRYLNLFGNPWSRADTIGPLISAQLAQPTLELPFLPYEGWSLTAGPHNAWNAGTPLGALDFSPIAAAEPCEDSAAWVTASAAGLVVRARDNVVALDLDGDGEEGSGWVIVYYHIAEEDMIPEGTTLAVDQRIGHPSCEGGIASGTHVHIARKYNGEWTPTDGPVPFVLSDWRVVAGPRIYQGTLIKDDKVITADPAGRAGSTIIR